MNADNLLSLASFLESRRKASAFVLAALLFFVASITGISEIVKVTFATFALPSYVIAAGLLVFCYAIALLVLSACRWVLSLSARAFKSLSAFLVSKFRSLQSAFATRRLVKRRIANIVEKLTPQERAFLELFRANNGVMLQSAACELLPYSTYVAHWSLIKKGLVVKAVSARESCVEHFALSTEVISTLRKLIYNGKQPVLEIELQLGRVAASGASGSGA